MVNRTAASEDGDYFSTRPTAPVPCEWYKNYDFASLQESASRLLYSYWMAVFLMVGDAPVITPNGLRRHRYRASSKPTRTAIHSGRKPGGTKKDGGKDRELTSDGGFIVYGITVHSTHQPELLLRNLMLPVT